MSLCVSWGLGGSVLGPGGERGLAVLLVPPTPWGHREGQAPPDQGQVHAMQGQSVRVSEGRCCKDSDLSPGPCHSCSSYRPVRPALPRPHWLTAPKEVTSQLDSVSPT